MASNRRRLAQDHAALRAAPPPDYFFISDSQDDLTGLSIYLVGPASTPFESGVFHLSLRIPPTYPQEPPKANFQTKIFHPNVDDRTGDICVDTLKRDWNPKLTLHDILVTIRCLLVFPNPTSSLNEAAGKLLLEDYNGFARHAELMTEVHAVVPEGLRVLVLATRTRKAVDEADESPSAATKQLTASMSSPNAAPKPAASRHKRKLSRPSTTVIRKVKLATSPKVSTGAEPDSDGDSGKENVVARHSTSSPLGIKRPREEIAGPLGENEMGPVDKDASEKVQRKTVKVKENATAKPGRARKDSTASSVIISAAMMKQWSHKKANATTKPGAKKSTARVGLKRF